MATYFELLDIATTSSGDALKRKIQVAVIIAADVIRAEAPPANSAQRLAWARLVMDNPSVQAERMLWAVLAQNSSATVGAITGASDSAVQTAVNNAVNLLAGV